MTTSTKDLIAQIERDAKFIPQLLGETDFKNLLEAAAQRLRELDKKLEPISDAELLEIEALPKSITRESISLIAIDYFCQKNGLTIKEAT